MKFTSDVCAFSSETAATIMLDFRSIVFCLLLALICPFYAGRTAGINSGNDAGSGSIEQKCSKDADCKIPNTHCLDSVCQCANGYVINGSLTACVPIATGYGDHCAEAIECSKRLYSGAACLNNACECVADGYYYFNGRCNAYSGLFDKCNSDVDCYVHAEYGAAYCDKGKCSCSPGYYQREYRSCRPEAKKVGDACTIKNDCRFDENADCDSDNKCTEAEFNAITESMFSVYKEENSNDTVSDFGNCTTDGDCKLVNNTDCSALGKCICKTGYFYPGKNKTCVLELGEPCNITDKAAIDYSECKNGKWNCAPGRVPALDNRKCLKAAKRFDWSCQYNAQCWTFGPDGICVEGKCVCNERSHFVESELFCWSTKGLGEQCQKDHDCRMKGTGEVLACEKNVCVCPSGTHLNADNTTCLENYIGIGSDCANDTECQPKNSICREKLCACKEGYVSDSFKSCIAVAPFGSPCDLDIQCSTVVPNATCISLTDTDKICGCGDDRNYKFDRCNVKKVLGDSCTNLGDCYLSSNDYRVTCRNGRCACDWAYIRENDTTCAPRTNARYQNNGNSANSISGGLLSILMTTLLSISYHSSIKRY
ncbi:uncharacterized protein LOC117218573 [Megalopta genalis]|uniref:uncharacterized protein LOC117218573 n=1 Tax=Megalopta genalis TaxID=115081 RepID=UPI003FD5E4C8